jgi:hypothetical protein
VAYFFDPRGLKVSSPSCAKKVLYHRLDARVYELLRRYAELNCRSVASSAEFLLSEALSARFARSNM